MAGWLIMIVGVRLCWDSWVKRVWVGVWGFWMSRQGWLLVLSLLSRLVSSGFWVFSEGVGGSVLFTTGVCCCGLLRSGCSSLSVSVSEHWCLSRRVWVAWAFCLVEGCPYQVFSTGVSGVCA